MQKAVYLSLDEAKLPANSTIRELFDLHLFDETWETLLYMIDNPEVQLFIYQLHHDFDINKKILTTIFELNPILPVMVLISEDDEREDYSKFNENIKIVNANDDIKKIYKRLKVMQRRYYRTDWPLKVNVLLNLDQPTEGELLTLSAGGGYIKLNNTDIIKEHKNLTLEINFQEFSFMADAELIQTFPLGQGNMPPGFSIQFVNVTEATQKYIEKIINNKIMNNIMSVFKES